MEGYTIECGLVRMLRRSSEPALESPKSVTAEVRVGWSLGR